jgi:diguanylate cyclase (GGDEF)-like protein
VLNMREVSERKAFERELAHRAFHDALTGLPNRALFRDRVEHALSRAHRDGGNVAVLLVDLDDMKWVNDSLGHAAGDALLREVADRLARTARAADTVARLGGDEYAILLDGSDDPMVGVAVAERVLDALVVPVTIDGHAFPVRASIGVAHAELRGTSVQDADILLRNADAAMYVAKEAGKGRYRVFEDAMHDEALARLALKNDLQRALERGEFHLEYQPVVALESGRIAGLEALLRWRHPERGLVSPAEFVPLAEETGVIVPIGEWVLREACAHAARLHAATPHEPPVGIAVNVSARQLQRPQIVGDVRAALAESGIPASTLTLELTETVLVSDVDLAVLRLHELRSIGVNLAIDDFGTGYSSLTYLRHFPLDILKVDKSFVDDVGGADGTGPLTAAILDLARVLGLRAVAEGIEDPRQIEVLRRLGCELGQGYALYRPLSADASEAAVRTQPVARVR